jgi:hypothetical protein
MPPFLGDPDAVRIGDWAESFGKKAGLYSPELQRPSSSARRVGAAFALLLVIGTTLIALWPYTGITNTSITAALPRDSELPARVLAEQ